MGKSQERVARIKHRQFAKEYIKQGLQDHKKAYKKVYPEASDITASVNSSKLIKTKTVEQEIDRHLQKASDRITADYIMDNLERIGKEAKKDSDKLTAWIALGRAIALFKDTPTTQTAVINTLDLDAIKKQIAAKKGQTSDNPQIEEEVDCSKSNNINKLPSSTSDNDNYVKSNENEGEGTVGPKPPSHP